MAAYRRVYDSRHLQADCQEPGSAPEPYARQSSMGYLYLKNSAWFNTYLSVHAGQTVEKAEVVFPRQLVLEHSSADVDRATVLGKCRPDGQRCAVLHGVHENCTSHVFRLRYRQARNINSPLSRVPIISFSLSYRLLQLNAIVITQQHELEFRPLD